LDTLPTNNFRGSSAEVKSLRRKDPIFWLEKRLREEKEKKKKWAKIHVGKSALIYFKILVFSILNTFMFDSFWHYSRVLLLRQMWMVNYYVKYSSDNLVMKTKTLVFQRSDISKTIHVLSWNIYFRLLRKKNTNWKSTIIWRNNWCCIIWRSIRTWLISFGEDFNPLCFSSWQMPFV
jgi:hypothetical protein